MKSCSFGWVTHPGLLSSGRKRDLAQDWRCLQFPGFPRHLVAQIATSSPPNPRNCRCGHHLDVFGHRAVCARAGVLSRRGYALESVDLDLEIADRADARRLEVAVDGLPLFGGAQLAIARRGVSVEDGVALTAARRRKEHRFPELVGLRSRARLVVVGVEVQGRWSDETKLLVSQLARAKARQEPWLLRRRVEQAWRMRWGSLIACAVARTVALSLLELPRAGVDGDTPAACDVERDFIHVGWRREAHTGCACRLHQFCRTDGRCLFHFGGKNCGGEGKKRAKFWAVRRRGVLRRSGRGWSKPTTTPPTPQHNTTHKIGFGQNWTGQSRSNQDGQDGVGQSRSLPPFTLNP